MRNRAARAAIAACGLAVSVGSFTSALAAQSVKEYERRVDRLAAESKTASLALVEYRKLQDERAELRDTVRAGSLQVLTSREIEPVIRVATEHAFAILQARLGSATAPLASHVFFARADHQALPNGEFSILTGERGPRGETRSGAWQAYQDTGANSLTQALVSLGQRTIALAMPPRFRDWSTAFLPTDSMTAADWSKARVAMVSSPTTAVRRCYDGSLADCRTVLGLSNVADPVLEWYDARDRRRMVQRLVEREYMVASSPVAASCLVGADSACVTALRRNPGVASPFADVNRSSLVELAVSIGGPGALERLLTGADNSPEEHLAAVAGVSVDSLVKVWQHNVHDTRVPSDNISGRMALMSAAWILVLGGLSLRSSRWR